MIIFHGGQLKKLENFYLSIVSEPVMTIGFFDEDIFRIYNFSRRRNKN